MANDLFLNLDKINISEEAVRRIRKNLDLTAEDVFLWCREKIADPETLTRTQSSFNVRGDGFVIFVDSGTFEIITARREKSKKGSDLSDVGIIKRLHDIPELKEELIRIFDQKTHRRVSQYALLLADHILRLANLPACAVIEACYSVIRRWQDGNARFQEARDVAFDFHELAREEKDAVKEKALRTLGQIAAVPHVKRHALIASDYAVKVVNLIYPGDMEQVKKERELQIDLMKSV